MTRLPGDPIPGCSCTCCRWRIGCFCLDHPPRKRCKCDYCVEYIASKKIWKGVE